MPTTHQHEAQANGKVQEAMAQFFAAETACLLFEQSSIWSTSNCM